jgi:hypothetical protein
MVGWLSSAPHSLLATGRVDAAHPDLATDPLGILHPASKLCHSLPLVSILKLFLPHLDPVINKCKVFALKLGDICRSVLVHPLGG